jgi:hypothetical protein
MLKKYTSENNNLAKSYPEKRRKLLNMPKTVEKETNAQVSMGLNPEYIRKL